MKEEAAEEIEAGDADLACSIFTHANSLTDE